MTAPMTPPSLARAWLFPIATTALLALAIVLIAPMPSPWAGWRPATCLPLACFCEGIRDQLVRQPANTISSLLFVVPGLALIGRGPGPERIGALTYGGALIVIGLGSAWYHASLTFVGQTFDVLGMYLIGTFALCTAARRRFGISSRTMALGYITINAALLTLLVVAPGARRYAFGGLVIGSLVIDPRAGDAGRRQRLRLALGLFVVAATFWALDLSRIGCSPTSWLQGHAVWHGLTAAAAGLFFHYTTEGAT